MFDQSRWNYVVKDPVCGMIVDEKKTPFRCEYKGKTYHFCAAQCKQKFDQTPDKFAKA